MLSVVLLCLTVPMVLVVVAMQGTHCAKITHSLSLDLADSPQPSPPSSLGVIFEVIFGVSEFRWIQSTLLDPLKKSRQYMN